MIFHIKVMQPQFFGKIQSGKWNLNRGQVFDAYISGQKDGDYYLVLHKVRGSPKTLEQLGYYYAVIVPTVYKQLVDDGHDRFVVNTGGKFKEVPLTTDIVDLLLKEACAFDEKLKRNMTLEQCSAFIDRCIRWSAKYLACVIPPPNET